MHIFSRPIFPPSSAPRAPATGLKAPSSSAVAVVHHEYTRCRGGGEYFPSLPVTPPINITFTTASQFPNTLVKKKERKVLQATTMMMLAASFACAALFGTTFIHHAPPPPRSPHVKQTSIFSSEMNTMDLNGSFAHGAPAGPNLSEHSGTYSLVYNFRILSSRLRDFSSNPISSYFASRFPSSLSPFFLSSLEDLLPLAPPQLIRFAAAQQEVDAKTAVVTFGYIRFAYPVLDYEASLAGYMAAIHYVNANKIIPGVFFQLNVTTIPCYDGAACTKMNASNAAMVTDFLDKIGNFSAVLRPSYLFADSVLKAAKRVGVPVFDPQTTSLADFSAGSEHLIHFNHYLSRQIDHLFTFMQQDYGCAYSGIVMEVLGDINTHVAHAQKLFADGGLPIPPVIDVNNISDEELFAFFTEDSRRKCFMVLTCRPSYQYLVKRITNMLWSRNISTTDFHVYGAASMADDMFTLNNSTKAYRTTHFVQWNPIDSYSATTFAPAYEVFEALANNKTSGALDDLTIYINNPRHQTMSTPREILSHFMSGQVPRISATALQSWSVIRYAMYACRSAVARYYDDSVGHRLGLDAAVIAYNTDLNAGFPLRPFDHADLVNLLYTETYVIEGYAYKQLVRECPRAPREATAANCFCNTVATTAFVYKPNMSSSVGRITPVWDDTSVGQRGIATIDVSAGCGYEKTLSAYPITGLLMYPSEYTADPERSTTVAMMEGWHDAIMSALTAMVYEANYAASKPVRPLRFVPFVVDRHAFATSDSVLQAYSDSYNPFALLGSLHGAITQPKVLTLFPTWLGHPDKDEPLVPHARWNPLTLSLLPSLSEYVHAAAAFYALYHVSHEANFRTEEVQQQRSSSNTNNNNNKGDNNDGRRDNKTDGGGIDLDSGTTTSQQTSTTTVNRFFTTVNVMCATMGEAEHISKSLATFGFNVPVDQMVIMNHYDNDLWEAQITEWMKDVPLPTSSASSSSSSAAVYEPFFIVTAFKDISFVLRTVFQTASRLNRPAALALVTPDTSFLQTMNSANLTADTLASEYPHETLIDIIFPAFRSEWWSPSARGYTGIPTSLSDHFLDPFFHMAIIAHQFGGQLASYAQSDVSLSAADIVYQYSPTITVGDMTFGPFSNASCTDADVRLNTQDRLCQCKKGSRRTHIHSALDFQQRTGAGTASRTNEFSYTLTKCGIVYKAYTAPPSDPVGLSAGAIAGIVVGMVSSFVVFVVGVVVMNKAFFGRNNKAAPKDSTKPFAVVFTDIQSSTALWARAPSTMSEAVVEHHAIMRRILRRNNGYEVKTVGDSFMIALKSPTDAVSFALEAQLAFNEADWSNEIDAIYVELLAEAGIGVNGEDLTNNNYKHHRRNNGSEDRDESACTEEEKRYTHNEYESNKISGAGDYSEGHESRSLSVAQNISREAGTVVVGGGAARNSNVSPVTPNTNNIMAGRPMTTITLMDCDSHSQSQGGNEGGGGGGYLMGGPSHPLTPSFASRNQNNNNRTLNAATAQQQTSSNNNNDNGSFTGGDSSVHSIGCAPNGSSAQLTGALPHSSSPTAASRKHHLATLSIGAAAGGGGGGFPIPSAGGNITPVAASGIGGGNAALYNHPNAINSHYNASGTSLYLPSQQHDDTTTANNNAVTVSPAEASVMGHPRSTAFNASASAQLHNNDYGGGGPPIIIGDVERRSTAHTYSTTMAKHHANNHGYNMMSVSSSIGGGGGGSKPNTNSNVGIQHGGGGAANDAMASNAAPSLYATATVISQSYVSGSGDILRSVTRADNHWHGIRVRIGVHYGLGDIRKDPITQGYDYYGTVVNTAARVEGVGHGGQILVTEEALNALEDGFAKRKRAVVIELGPQPLRGLDAPVTLYQFTPATLEARRFPALRLHIEKETEDTEATDTNTQTASSDAEPPEAIAARLCAAKQYHRVLSAADLVTHFDYFLATFAPTNEKYTAQVIAKLGASWGFEKSSQAVKATNSRNRMLMAILAKISKTVLAGRKARNSNAANGKRNNNNTTTTRSFREGSFTTSATNTNTPSCNLAPPLSPGMGLSSTVATPTNTKAPNNNEDGFEKKQTGDSSLVINIS